MCSCTYTRQCTAARGMRRREWLVLIIARTATSSFASWRPWESQRTHLKTALSPLRTVRQKKLLSLAVSLIYRTGASFRVSVTVVNSVCWPKHKVWCVCSCMQRAYFQELIIHNTYLKNLKIIFIADSWRSLRQTLFMQPCTALDTLPNELLVINNQ